jgi:hypothetical protein
MDVEIGEVTTEVRVLDAHALLSPDVLARIVAAVTAELDSRARADRTRKSETVIRSVVEQQRRRGD